VRLVDNSNNGRAPNLFWMGALALGLTLLTGGVWLVLLVGNLKTTPSIPWSIAVMAAVLYGIWRYFNGKWKPENTSGIRHHLMRAHRVPTRTFTWALLAGVCSIVALVGFWIVLSELVKLPTNTTLSSSSYPRYVSILVAAMGAVSGSITEEIGFRGYFQRTLEMKGWGARSIVITALLISPAHALTQGFVWPVLVFYLLVDIMLGAMAYLTNSIVPGVLVHALGLFIFLVWIWPSGSTGTLIPKSGLDVWFWVNRGQIVIFGIAAFCAFKRLARMGSREVTR
jgi:membrane protease YdiL (CAAX protease family)